MSASTGTRILAADYDAIQSKISSVLGTPSGDYGYGQTTVSAPVAVGQTATAADWNKLITDINRAYGHIYDTTPTLPTISGVIRAVDVNSIAAVANTCDTNRLTVAATNTMLFAPSASTTITRTTAWGSGTTGITCVASFTWASEASASAFFNTGGYVSMALAHTTTSTPQDSAWNAFLSSFGAFIFSGSGSRTTQTSPSGAIASLPYSAYSATGTIVANKLYSTTSSYTANYLSVTLTKIANGFNVTVLLEDNHTNSYFDTVAAGTKAAFGWSVASDTNYLPTAIARPTFTATTGF